MSRNFMQLFLILFLLLFYFLPAQAGQSLDGDAALNAAQQAYDSKNYKAAIEILVPLAEQGNAEAQYDIGDLYNKGLGLKRDKEEAAQWFLKAAGADNLEAQESLGELYKDGLNGAPNYEESYFWYRLAGRMFGVDDSAANEILTHLSREQKVKADQRVAEWKPRPIPKDAINDQLLAGKRQASLEHGWVHDFRGAAVLLFPLAEQGNLEAQKIIAFEYYWGETGRLDREEAAKWYVKAAEQRDIGAMVMAAGIYDSNETNIPGKWKKPNYPEAAHWYSRAAEMGDVTAQEKLGGMYIEGRGVKQDKAEGLKWLIRAASPYHCNNWQAIFDLAIRYRTGDGVPQSDIEAYFWGKVRPINWDSNSLEIRLTPEQKSTVEKRVKEWRKKADANNCPGDPLAE